MSTRCNILITQDGSIKYHLYHHYDGYPKGVGNDLLTFFKDKEKTFWDCEDIVNSLLKRKDDEEYKLTSDIHGDIEYLYEIVYDGRNITGIYLLKNTVRYEPSKRVLVSTILYGEPIVEIDNSQAVIQKFSFDKKYYLNGITKEGKIVSKKFSTLQKALLFANQFTNNIKQEIEQC